MDNRVVIEPYQQMPAACREHDPGARDVARQVGSLIESHLPGVEDEFFLVIKRRFRMEFRDRHVWLEEGEFLVVPRGIEHRPVAEEEAHVLLFEPATTLNTGNVKDERTVIEPGRI